VARIINTATDIDKLIGISSYHAYNALDSCVTREVFDKIAAKLDNQHTNSTYRDARALQAPVLSMTQTGCLVDQKTRGELLAKYQADGDFLTKQLKQLLFGYIDASIEFGFLPETERAKFADFNWRSGDQLKHFFYDILNMPAVLNDKGNPSVDRDALERLVRYPVATPYCKILMQLRDIGKAITDLTKDLDADGRFRASFNIAGTTTGRFSSYKSAFDTGSNAQNQDPLLRKMFCSDKGKKLAYVDLEQAEARLVGAILFNLFGDSKYLDACEGGDTHTNVAKMVWPDIIKSKADAEQPFYRNFSYRFICKRLGFGCLTPDHEVLTRNGWVPITEKPEEIMCWSPLKSFFDRPSDWFDFEYKGDMVDVEGTAISLSMTGNHRVFYTTDKKGGHTQACARDLPKSARIPLGSQYIGGKTAISSELARIIAAIQCDGYAQSGITYRFTLKKARKVARLKMLADNLGIKFSDFSQRNTYAIELGHNVPKYAGAYLLDWPSDALKAYIDEHKFWDGHQAETSTSISSVNFEHIEWLQTIGRLVGIGGNIQKPHKTGFSDNDCWPLQQNHRQFAHLSACETSQYFTQTRVLCPSVPSSAFYIRRNGKISVTGNSNYGGLAQTLSQETKIPRDVVGAFQNLYFETFPLLHEWHKRVACQVEDPGYIVSLMGRKRWFFGRADDDSTIREAIAYDPQESVAKILNIGLFNLWYKSYRGAGKLPLDFFFQVHDAVLLQYPEEQEAELLPQICSLIQTPITLRSARQFTIPAEAKIGWNWGDYDGHDNADGLVKWDRTCADGRTRSRPPSLSILDQQLR
jgi:hypothetical protein